MDLPIEAEQAAQVNHLMAARFILAFTALQPA